MKLRGGGGGQKENNHVQTPKKRIPKMIAYFYAKGSIVIITMNICNTN